MPTERHPLALLLETLDREGFHLRLDDGRLEVSPRDRLTSDLREAVRRSVHDLAELARLFGPSGLLALFSGRTLSEAEYSLLAEKARELRDRLPKTENQCGQCSEWRLSRLVELGHSERIYLCEDCLAEHQGSGATFVGSAVAI
jgi:bacterioferritin-associated ferredoxin